MSSFAIKMVAIFSMLWDHIYQFLPLQTLMVQTFGMDPDISREILGLLWSLGRLAFPIFAFLIGEGCRHTRSASQYIGRLLLFGLISEFPFRWVQLREIRLLRPGVTNIFFTLALGAAACEIYRSLRGSGKKGWQAYSFGCALLLVLAAEIWGTDYGALGVLLVFFPYILEKRGQKLAAMGVILTVLYMGKASWNGVGFYWMQSAAPIRQWLASLLALVFTGLYNGERGRRAKWVFYWFYPAHLTGIAVIQQALIAAGLLERAGY